MLWTAMEVCWFMIKSEIIVTDNEKAKALFAGITCRFENGSDK